MKIKQLLFIVVLLLCTVIAHAQHSGEKKNAPDSTAWFCSICGDSCDTLVFHQAGSCSHCGMPLQQQNLADRKKLIQNYLKKMTICFYLQDGVEVLDFAGPMEVFSYAGFNVFTVSRKKEPIVAQGILKILPDYSIDDAPRADILAFFGGNAGIACRDSAVVQWVEQRARSASYLFSVCTGAFIIGKAGLLKNQSATTFHASIESLRNTLPDTKVLSDARFVDNGKVITTAGISAGIDGALHLVAKLKGQQLAKEVAAYMEYDKWVPGEGVVVKGR